MERKLHPGQRDPQTVARYARPIAVRPRSHAARASNEPHSRQHSSALVPQPVTIPVTPSPQPFQDIVRPVVVQPAPAAKKTQPQPVTPQFGTYFDLKPPRRVHTPREQKILEEAAPVTIEVPAHRRPEAAVEPAFLYENDVLVDQIEVQPKRRRWFGFRRPAVSSEMIVPSDASA